MFTPTIGAAELHVRAGGLHGFDGIAPDTAISRGARDSRVEFLRRILSSPGWATPRLRLPCSPQAISQSGPERCSLAARSDRRSLRGERLFITFNPAGELQVVAAAFIS